MTSEERRVSWWERVHKHAYLVTMFVKSLAWGLMMTQNQYVYRRVAASYTNDLTSLANVTANDACSTMHVNTSSADYQLYAKISAETARWNMYLTVCMFTPTIAVILLLGAYSDHVGRRFLFLISLAGAAAKGVVLCLTVYLELHLGFLLLAELLDSITGGGSSLAIATFSYTADQHIPAQANDAGVKENNSYVPDDSNLSKDQELGHKAGEDSSDVTTGVNHASTTPQYDKNRAVRLLFLESFNVCSAGIVQLINGYFIAYAGFFYVFLTATILIFIDFIFTFVVIKDVKNQVKKTRSIFEPFRIIGKAVRQPRKMSSFILCNLAVVLVCFGDGGLNRTMPVYQMSPPFCWSSVQIGWFNSEFFFVTLLAVPFLMLLRRSGLSEPTMAGIGSTINAVGTAIYAFANSFSWIFYAMAAVTVPGMLAFALTRTITSRLAGPEAHGAMFAFTTLVENIMFLIGSLAGNGIYEYTVAKLHSAVFFYYAAVYMSAALVYYLEALIERCHPPYDNVGFESTISNDDHKAQAPHTNGLIHSQEKVWP